jgi:hypothetical protein
VTDPDNFNGLHPVGWRDEWIACHLPSKDMRMGRGVLFKKATTFFDVITL